MDKPLVSICCLSYNQAKFIRQCLDGFLFQETTFPVEILIHDDCSTDGTAEIIQEYATKYPDKVFPIFEDENKYSHGWKGKMELFNFDRTKGKYVAYCEGDDYWTDPLKLQKQVDFLEAHPEYSCCFHRFTVVNENDEYLRDSRCDTLIPQGEDGVDIGIDTFFSNWYTQPMSFMFRFDLWERNWHFMYKNFCDTYEIYHLLKKGKGRIMNFNGGRYRVHGGGVAGGVEKIQGYWNEIRNADELLAINNDIYTQKYWEDLMYWILDSINDRRVFISFVKHELWMFPLKTTKVLFKYTKRKIKNTSIWH